MSYRLCCPVCIDPESGVVIPTITTAGRMKCPLCKDERTIDQKTSENYHVGQWCRKARIDAQMTLRTFAEKIGLTPAQLSDVEHARCADEATVARVCAYWEAGS